MVRRSLLVRPLWLLVILLAAIILVFPVVAPAEVDAQ